MFSKKSSACVLKECNYMEKKRVVSYITVHLGFSSADLDESGEE